MSSLKYAAELPANLLEEKSPKVVRRLLAEGFALIGCGRGRLVFGKEDAPVIFKVSWRRERTGKDMNETEWKYYQSLSAPIKRLVVPIRGFYKLADGNSVLIQAAADTILHPTRPESLEALQIMESVGVKHDHVARNFGYYKGELRILDIDSPTEHHAVTHRALTTMIRR
jgi:hypothetical protein